MTSLMLLYTNGPRKNENWILYKFKPALFLLGMKEHTLKHFSFSSIYDLNKVHCVLVYYAYYTT